MVLPPLWLLSLLLLLLLLVVVRLVLVGLLLLGLLSYRRCRGALLELVVDRRRRGWLDELWEAWRVGCALHWLLWAGRGGLRRQLRGLLLGQWLRLLR